MPALKQLCYTGKILNEKPLAVLLQVAFCCHDLNLLVPFEGREKAERKSALFHDELFLFWCEFFSPGYQRPSTQGMRAH